jgi:AbrB family looped-hinge helix DNA binding protein
VGRLEAEVEEKGRITIPAQIRRNLGIAKGDKLDISTKDGALILKRKRTVTVSDIQGIMGKHKVKLQDIDNAMGRDEVSKT